MIKILGIIPEELWVLSGLHSKVSRVNTIHWYKVVQKIIEINENSRTLVFSIFNLMVIMVETK